MTAIKADPHDPEDFDVSAKGVEKALEDRRKRRGRPAGSNKQRVTMRLDKEIVDKFKTTGPGWQSRINEALKKVDVKSL